MMQLVKVDCSALYCWVHFNFALNLLGHMKMFFFFFFLKSGVSFKSNWHTNIWHHVRQSTFKFGYDWFRPRLFPLLRFIYLINDFVFLFLFLRLFTFSSLFDHGNSGPSADWSRLCVIETRNSPMAESSLHFTSMSACARSATGVTQSCAGLPRGVWRSAPRGSAHRSRTPATERQRDL